MDATLDKLLEDGSARYVAAKTEGQKLIRRRWAMLAPETKTALLGSGFYSERGERLETERPVADLPQYDAERLEYGVGLFKLCIDAKLPSPTDMDLPFPMEASTDEVLTAAGELLNVRAWQDPFFLRLALGAVGKHEEAVAIGMFASPSSLAPAWGCLGELLKFALIVAMPVALASGIAAASRQDVGGGALAFYFFGFGLLAAMKAGGVGVKKKEWFELAYVRWLQFKNNSAVGVSGAGALEHLRRMAHEGVSVPSIAFDLADTLRSRTAGFSENTGAAQTKRDA